MGQAASSVPQHVSLPEHVNLPEHDALSARQHVSSPQHVSLREHVNLPQYDGMSTQQHVSFQKHATQLTKTTVPVVGTVSRRIDPEQTELEEDSIPRPATVTIGLSRTVSEINGDFRRKSPILPPPCIYSRPLKGLPLELGIGARVQKIRMMMLPDG